MDILKSMSTFAEVARLGAFAATAQSLGISTTSVSRQVMELESWLGKTLFQRTTRKLSLTEEGAFYLTECQRVLSDITRIQNTALDTIHKPTGTLRVSAPVFLAKECMQRVLPGFLNSNPNVAVEIVTVDRFVDLIDEGFDVALRVGDLPDSTLVSRGFGQVRLMIVASPKYIEQCGEPLKVRELKNHNCIVDTVASFSNRWPVKLSPSSRGLTVSGNVTVNNGELARNLALDNVGLAILPEFFVMDQIDKGQLVEVLPGSIEANVGMFAVYPQSRHLAPKVRAFIDALVDYFDKLKIMKQE